MFGAEERIPGWVHQRGGLFGCIALLEAVIDRLQEWISLAVLDPGRFINRPRPRRRPTGVRAQGGVDFGFTGVASSAFQSRCHSA